MTALYGWNDNVVPLEVGTNRNAVTREQERMYDHYLQKKVFSLMEKDEYSNKKWEASAKEERKKMLESFIRDVQKIFGLNVPASITFEAIGSMGNYDHDAKTLTIDPDYLKSSGYKTAMTTAIHEMRHAYQYSAVDDPKSFNVSSETIEQWKNNINNYIEPQSGSENTNLFKAAYEDFNKWRRYVSQPIEYDAKNFAKESTLFSNPDYKGSWGWKLFN